MGDQENGKLVKLRDYLIVAAYVAAVTLLGYFFYGDVQAYLSERVGPEILLDVVTSVGILVAVYLTGKLVRRGLVKLTDTVDWPETTEALIRRAGVWAVYAVGLVIILGQFGVDIGSLVTGLGFLSLAIGFAAQEVLGNFIGGALLSVNRPFEIRDYVRIGEHYGEITDMDSFRTYILSFDKVAYSIPNSTVLKSRIENYTSPTTTFRLNVDITISYDSDLDLAERIILATLEEYPYLDRSRPLNVYIYELADFAVRLRVRFYVPHRRLKRRALDYFQRKVLKRFKEAGIEMPYPTQEVIYREKTPVKEMVREDSK